ncbi:MAG: rhomboid family intramembrane serine protease [Bacteroidales bacterium]
MIIIISDKMYYNQSPFTNRRPSFKSTIKRFITSSSTLNRLIVINIGIYLAFLLLDLTLSLGAFLMNNHFNKVFMLQLTDWLACPASFARLLYQPWSILTSLFLHTSFWHLLFNMIMLYVAGRIFLEYLTEKKLLITYLIGGIFGNLFYMAAYQIFPVFATVVGSSVALGASGSIMAILVAITVYRPHHEIILLILGRMKLVWLTIIFVVIDLLSLSQGNAGGHIAHLGGALYGVLSVLFYLHYPAKQKTKKKKPKFYTSYESATSKPLSDEEYNSQKVAHQKKIDEILDKISKNGYDALSREEKEYLFMASKK